MSLSDEIEKLEREKNATRFAYLIRVCQENFGNPRINGSHHIFKMPWQGDPRINIQTARGNAKPYQVEQVIDALQRLLELEEKKKRDEQDSMEGKA